MMFLSSKIKMGLNIIAGRDRFRNTKIKGDIVAFILLNQKEIGKDANKKSLKQSFLGLWTIG